MSDITIIEGDSLVKMKSLATGSFDFIYVDPPFVTEKDRGDFDDRWGSVLLWSDWFEPFVKESYRLLSDTGSIVVHLDYRAIHYARVLMDQTFGYDNMLNEIIWCYASGGVSKRWLARKHDNLIWYVKDTKDYTFNVQREPYATPNVEGRKGFHDEGRMLNDWWRMSFLSTTASERVGYDSQKPEALLERLLTVFTNPGDNVLDFMAGSGTTGAAASSLGRKATLIDKNPNAIKKMKERI